MREAAQAMITAWEDGEYIDKHFFRGLRDALAEDRLDEMQALTESEYLPSKRDAEDAFVYWWDEGTVSVDNPYRHGSPAYWAWEGWQAGVKAEREACAKVVENYAGAWDDEGYAIAQAIRARGVINGL